MSSDTVIMHGQTMPERYQAWVWRNSADPLDLKLESVDTQPLPPGHVWVKNEAIGLNPVDWKVLGGDLVNWQPGHVPGVDGAGVVVAVGEGVAAHWVGQRVVYHTSLHLPGSFAHYTPAPARALMRLPASLGFELAASFACPGLTAWMALEKLPLKANQQVLLSGAGGGVGHYFVQFASARGVAVTAMSHPRHWDRLRQLGADACVAGPLPAGQPWQPANGTFHAVVDSVDADHAQRLVPALRANGHIVCIQGRLPQWPNTPFGRALSLHEVALGALHVHGDDEDWARLTVDGERLLSDLAAMRLQPEDRRDRDFGGLTQLLADLRHRQFSGKPLIVV